MSRFPSYLLCLLCLTAPASAAESSAPRWPTVQRDAKPWSRWWWLGNIADKKSITAEMESYAAAGLGGLEVTPIYGVRGYEKQFIPFLSAEWMENFDHVLAEGRRLGLGIDLANGTGWPFGGPWLSDTDVAHYLAHRVYTVPAGAAIADTISYTTPSVLRFAGTKQVPLSDIKDPLTANENLQELAIDQVRFPKTLAPIAVIAYPEKGDSLDLTSRLTGGKLDWTAPTDRGAWKVYALFQGMHGKLVERAAPAAEGYALDHLSSTALKHYLAKFDEAFKGRQHEGLRAFFNDSYEVDDANGESDFSPKFLEEFTTRRGYDLRQHLPELFATTASDASVRVLSDYRETVADLLRDEFTVPWQKWAKQNHAIIRNQSHGAPGNLLDLYAASDIPEQEGSDILAIKLASSAAHVTGKPLASAEAGTWLNEHFLSTLAELKNSVDTFLLSGINHNCYHGTAFSPPDDPWPGFQFYASVELNPRNPFWSDFALVNAYVSRAQSFLQSGHPDEDVLLYYNIHDRWSVRGDGSLPHFHGSERDGVGARETGAALRTAGVGFDYISDRLLQDVTATASTAPGTSAQLRSASASYQAIVVPPTQFMPLATLRHLVTLAEAGSTIIVLDQLPRSAPGLRAEPDQFNALLARINAQARSESGVTTAAVGRGQFVIGKDLASLLAHSPSVRRENLGAPGLEHIRRRTEQGAFYFLVNRSKQSVDGWVTLQSPAKSAALFDPMTGQSGIGSHRVRADGRASEVYVQLAPGASLIVQLDNKASTGTLWNYWRSTGGPQSLSGEWMVRFDRGGPALPAATKLASLSSWTMFGGEAGSAFSGTATYSINVTRPSGEAAAWRLDLGHVGDSARVKFNGREIAGLIQAPWTVVIPTADWKPQNTLEIEVTNLAANRIADQDRRDPSWKKFYNVNMPARRRENTGPDKLFTAAHWKPRPSGLLGPVTLTALAPLPPPTP